MDPHWLIPESAFSNYDEYLSAVGSSAVAQARKMPPEAVLSEVARSGLRGRGGAGFPTGTKWQTLRNHDCKTRYVVCNAAEGEPGTFKDRWLIRHNPFAVLEGLAIAAHVIDAKAIYIGLKASFEQEQSRLQQALTEMAGDLDGIEFHIVPGPEEYLFGEEKALLEVLSGNDPLPREAHRPPYEIGLFPTPHSPNPALVNNAETYAHVQSIVRHGSSSFRKLGTDDTPGTVIFTVTGDVQRPGVYEAEAGITLERLFNEIAGGAKPGRTLKATLSGVSNRVLTADRFGVRADFGSLTLAGSGMGSAGFMVFDDTAHMPEVARAVTRFLFVESCNQCTSCKQGLRAASTALDELFDPDTASTDNVRRAMHGARRAPQGNRCYLPVQGSIVTPSLIETYAHEFEQQSRSGASARRFTLPKLVDYDPNRHEFTLDEDLATKQPDWSYAAAGASTGSRPAEEPKDHASAPTIVQLAPDVADRFVGPGLEDRVNAALRDWLKEHG